jgi:hypothetical protein
VPCRSSYISARKQLHLSRNHFYFPNYHEKGSLYINKLYIKDLYVLYVYLTKLMTNI